MPDVTAPVTFSKQETLFYCGPATLQMSLAALGTAPARPPTWQDRLWEDVKANTGATRPSGAPSTPTSPPFEQQKCEWCSSGGGWKCWSTTPGVLALLLNNQQNKAVYTVEPVNTDAQATGLVMDALDAKLPGIALVRGWQHWLVVDGYRYGEPGSTAVAGRNLNGVYICDPLATPSTHYVPWSTWKSDYLSSVPCGMYKERIVVFKAVPVIGYTPPAPPNAPTGIRIIDPPTTRSLSDRSIMNAQVLLSKDEAIRRASDGARALHQGRLQIAFAGATAYDAVLVQRLDDPDRYYYIVSYRTGSGDTVRLVVDGYDGTVEEVNGISAAGQVLPPFLAPAAALAQLHAEASTISDALRFRVRPGTVGTHPVLVWMPCGQSTSPFLPFYQMSVGDSFVYYRVDGVRFDELTTGPA